MQHLFFIIPILAAAVSGSAAPAAASDWFDLSQHKWSFVVEAGPQFAPSLEVSGAYQANATHGWSGTNPDIRLEAWFNRPGGLDLGVVVQPLFDKFSGTLSNDVNVKGQHFTGGAPASFDFQFPSVRFTGNYPVWSDGNAELRLGASLIVRYTSETLTSGPQRVQVTNTLGLPLLNIQGKIGLGGRWSGVAAADFLPAENGTGIYDAFIGVHYAFDDRGRAVELGARTFYGGFVPNNSSFLNNRILLESVALRLLF